MIDSRTGPPSVESGVVWRRTGDLVRISRGAYYLARSQQGAPIFTYCSAGRSGDKIYYYGRRDFTVKVQGKRFSLLEVATALASSPLLEDCAVVNLAGRSEMPLLAAVVVPAESSQWQTDQHWLRRVRQMMREQVEEHQRPFYVAAVAVLPRNSNGKVLPSTNRVCFSSGFEYV